MKKIVIIGVIVLGLIACAVTGYVLFNNFQPKETYVEANDNAKVAIKKIVNDKYPGYEIESLVLKYNDWSSSVQRLDDFSYKWHYATSADVIVKNDVEERTILLKGQSSNWRITSDYPDSGLNIPDGEYYVHMGGFSESNNPDIDRMLSYYWVVPNKNGELYVQDGKTVTIQFVEELFKTKDGKVYVFNRDINDWELSTVKYSELNYITYYSKTTAESAKQLLQKYASYIEE